MADAAADPFFGQVAAIQDFVLDLLRPVLDEGPGED
jgi:hypothetical protein